MLAKDGAVAIRASRGNTSIAAAAEEGRGGGGNIDALPVPRGTGRDREGQRRSRRSPERAAGVASDSHPPRHLRDLLSPAQARHMLERERARADRSGLGFCLVVFGPVSDSDGAAPSHPLARLARTVLRRARVTDEVGWFADESVAEAGASRAGRKLTASRVCALLPDTAAAGARRFAADVLDNLRSAAAAADGLPEFRIYGYGLAPAESDAVVTGHGRGRDKDKDDRNCGGNARNGGSSAATSHRRHGETTIPDHAATRLHDVEGLLIKHLPAW
ncbi:MAG TPA: hypothetical protein VH475_29280, partial [Tepidisphaeraceae bacterium]